MKLTRILTIVLPLVFLAAASNHQAFGPLHFGMSERAAGQAQGMIMQSVSTTGGGTEITAGTIRKHFVTAGTKYPPHLADKDGMVKVRLSWVCDPKVSQITLTELHAHGTAEYDTLSRQAWEILQDVCESKFGQTVDKKKGEWPKMETLPPAPGFVATDKWEVDGVRVELGINTVKTWTGDPFYAQVVLKATDVQAPK